MFKRKKRDLPQLKQMFGSLDAVSKKHLKLALLERLEGRQDRGLVHSSAIKDSPVLQLMIEKAAEDAMEKKSLVLESVDEYIDKHYEGKVDDFVKDRPAALYSIEVRNLNTLAAEIFKRAKDAYTEVLNGWPLTVSALAFKDRDALKAKYEAMALVVKSAGEHIADDIRLLQNIQERKTVEVASDIGGTELLATLESLIDTSTEIISELFDCSSKIGLAAEKIRKGRKFFIGKKKDQAKIPIGAIQAAIHIHHSSNRVSTALDTMAYAPGTQSPRMKAGLPIFSSQLYKFLKNANRTASLAGRDIIEELETQLSRGDVQETGIWWLISPVPMDMQKIKEDLENQRKLTQKEIKQMTKQTKLSKEEQNLLDTMLGPNQ